MDAGESSGPARMEVHFDDWFRAGHRSRVAGLREKEKGTQLKSGTTSVTIEPSELILLSGMGADARLFRSQLQAIPRLKVPTWIRPEPRESLPHYAERMLAQNQLSGSCFLGGASFGGAVSLEMACHVQPRACFLIGSLRGPEGLPRAYRRLRGVTGMTRWAPTLSRLALWTFGFAVPAVGRGVLEQLSASEGQFLTWATRALIDWSPSPAVSRLKIFQIHGHRDWVLPARLSRADLIIPSAGHLLSITHPGEVNAFLKSKMEAIVNSVGSP
jgi:pimeloyl-ACP methyl ester carboxylesterase